MSRRKNEKDEQEKIEDRFGWPWELTIDIGNLDPPKVAFLSGQDRQYFPENPGHTRHGIEFAMNRAPGDVPNPCYYPSEDRLQKPVSLLGYGIGGLLGPRFPRDPTDKIVKIPRRRTLDGPVEPPPPKRRPSVAAAIAKRAAEKERHKLLRTLCSTLAFGSDRDVPRFGQEPKWSSVGVGHYDVAGPNTCKKTRVMNSFGLGPVSLVAPTVIECTHRIFPCCCECENNQGQKDYYKSKCLVSLPKIRFFLSELDKQPKQPSKEAEEKLKPQRVVICRKCYCRIMREGHSFWRKYDLLTKFQKTRHCINIHEHNNLPICIHKVPCKLVRDLSRKEALMAKYFDDHCPKVIKEISNSYSASQNKPGWGKSVSAR